MYNQSSDFKKEILWKQTTTFCKLKPKQSATGKTYYQADMTHFLLVSNGVDNYGNIVIKSVPVKYTKNQSTPQSAPQQNADFAAGAFTNEETPF